MRMPRTGLCAVLLMKPGRRGWCKEVEKGVQGSIERLDSKIDGEPAKRQENNVNFKKLMLRALMEKMQVESFPTGKS